MLLKGKIYFIRLIRIVFIDLIFISVISVIAGFLAYGQYYENLHVPLALIAIVGTALSLLLAFRTSQSYDRWWEARIVWGAIVNDSRTLIRQVQLYLDETEKDAVHQFARRQIIWNFALSESLRKQPFSDRVQQYLIEHQIKDNNVPNGILSEHYKQLKTYKSGQLSDYNMVQIEGTLLKLCDSMGRCERIKNTIFPVSYSKMIHFIIYLFAVMLPFSLDNTYPVLKTFITAIIPILFIAIERTSILMQDPFENSPMDTPMTTLSRTIEVNLLQQIGEEAPPPVPAVPNDYYYIL
ncbi:bestrophin family protein [Polluticaenibacter yanchengensis]|uniref:Bestrophin family ion channel n=1 Tax=Polluticaenibacter yanchengensis TaxID=3014562 RepID=A0ABT4UIJ3_9BACT|nr:bestrophin family ion channel [Chitinophagaceae bacterium LY-5]